MLNYETYINDESKNWIVFVHGIGGSTLTWKKQIDDFSKNYNLLLLDLPGHGKSQAIDGKIGISFVNDCIKEVLDYLHINKADFVGMSMGTLVILNFAIKYPKYVKSLVLGGAIVNVEGIYRTATKITRKIKGLLPKPITYRMLAKIIMPAKWHEKSRKIFFKESKKLCKKNFFAWIDYTTNLKKEKGLIQKLKELNIKIFFISGDHDKCFIKGIEHLSQKLSNAEFEIIEKCGHVCTIERYREFNKKALLYLNNNNNPVLC